MPPKSLQKLPYIRPILHSNMNKIRVIIMYCQSHGLQEWRVCFFGRPLLFLGCLHICKFQEIGEEGYAGGGVWLYCLFWEHLSVSDCGRTNKFLIMWSSNTQEYLMFFCFQFSFNLDMTYNILEFAYEPHKFRLELFP